jgi:hypothetical protein
MPHQFNDGQFALQVRASLILDDHVVATWTREPVLPLGSPVRTAPGKVRFWDAKTGLPLSVEYWNPLGVEWMEFDEATTQFRILEIAARDTYLERIRQLPEIQFFEDPVRHGEVTTGTRINPLGDFEVLSAAEWNLLRQDSK